MPARGLDSFLEFGVTAPRVVPLGMRRLLPLIALSAALCLGPAPAQAVPWSTWERLAQCESSGNWHINTGNGYYGGLQFSLATWHGYGGRGMPNLASKAEQIRIAERTLQGQGWGAWPECSRRLGLR